MLLSKRKVTVSGSAHWLSGDTSYMKVWSSALWNSGRWGKLSLYSGDWHPPGREGPDSSDPPRDICLLLKLFFSFFKDTCLISSFVSFRRCCTLCYQTISYWYKMGGKNLPTIRIHCLLKEKKVSPSSF